MLKILRHRKRGNWDRSDRMNRWLLNLLIRWINSLALSNVNNKDYEDGNKNSNNSNN